MVTLNYLFIYLIIIVKLPKYPVDFHFSLTLNYNQGAYMTRSTNSNCWSNPISTTTTHNAHV